MNAYYDSEEEEGSLKDFIASDDSEGEELIQVVRTMIGRDDVHSSDYGSSVDDIDDMEAGYSEQEEEEDLARQIAE